MHHRQHWNQSARSLFNSWEQHASIARKANTMPEPAEDQIVRNLAKAIERLHEDLDRVELWTEALNCFQRPVPDYQSGERYLLPTRPQRRDAPA